MTLSSQLPANANASRLAFIGHEGSAPRARGKMNYDGYFSGFRVGLQGVSPVFTDAFFFFCAWC